MRKKLKDNFNLVSLIATLVFFQTSIVFAQDSNCFLTGDDLTITTGQTVVVNAYYPGTVSAATGNTSIELGNKRAFTPPTDLGGTISSGDLLLVVQMQGAAIDPTLPDLDNPATGVFTANDYGDGPGGLAGAGKLDDNDFIAGQYEYVIAANTVGAGGGTLNITTPLFNSYVSADTPTGSVGRRTFQIIKVGNFNNLTIDTGGELTTIPWDGATGGVIVIDALGTMTLEGTINANFTGFRGGILRTDLGEGGDAEPGRKGEGTAGSSVRLLGYNDDMTGLLDYTSSMGYPDPADTRLISSSVADFTMTFRGDRGPGGPGNAGGAGILNDGGAGGGNGAIGGKGANILFLAAVGGEALSLQQGSRVFLGGGGGSGGQSDDTNTTFSPLVASGRPGGGVVLIRTESLTSTAGTISVDGDDGGTNTVDVDGAGGGGGAGGTVILITSTDDISGLTISATGGDGANLDGVQQGTSPDGGGGGGGGGNVVVIRQGDEFTALPTIITTGGAFGRTQGTPPLESTGGDGSVSILNLPPSPNLVCDIISVPDPIPGGVDNSVLWMRADANTTFNGSNQVSEWGDFNVGSSINLTNTSVTGISGTLPDFIDGSFTASELSSNPIFNFNPSISFTGIDDYLGFEGFTNMGTIDLTVFVVTNLPTASGNDQTLISYLPNDGQNDELDLGVTDDNGANGVRASVLDNNIDNTEDIRDDITRLIATDYNSTDVNLWVNNGTATSATPGSGALETSGTFVIGQNIEDFATPTFDPTTELEGQISEVIIFDAILTATERQQVSSYLSIKYGITLDQTSAQDYLNSFAESIFPASTDAANYSAYNNDITGIGRDDGSRLIQLRSKSINTGTVLTANVSSFSIDRQFVIWGNNAAGLAFNTTEISAGITERIQREWRIALSNTTDPINLTFDLSGTTNTPLVTDQLALIIDDNGDFSDGFLRIVPATSWDGSSAIFLNVILHDDEVITIGEVPNTPGGVSDIVLWLKADVGVTSGGNGTEVTAWADQSGNGLNFASQNLTGPTEIGPTHVTSDANFNGNPTFAYTDNYLARDPFASFPTNDISIFIVSRPDAGMTGATQGPFGYGADVFKFRDMGNITIEYNNGATAIGGNVLGFTNILSATSDDLNNETRLYINGTGDAENANPITRGALVNNDEFVIGQDSDSDETLDAGEEFVGSISEILLYNSELSNVDRQKVESYLAIKYGVTLDSDETNYIASDGSTIYQTVTVPADYNNDIAGIGRDDISILDQRKSKSVNTDAIVTMALTDNGGTFTSPNPFSDNISYLAWGNDNDNDGTIVETSTELPDNVSTRLDREWRVQEKGNVGNVTFEVDLNGITVTGTTVDDFLLLLESGGDFSSGLTNSYTPTSFTANILTFNIDFSHGDIFTIATSKISTSPGGVSDNLTVWLRSDREVFSDDGGTTPAADTDGVQVWNDQAQSISFVEDLYAASTTPEFISSTPTLNGQPALDFNNGGTGDYLAATIPAGGAQTATSVLMAFQSNDTQSSMFSYQDAAGNDIQVQDPEAFLGTVGTTNTGTNFTDVVANDDIGHITSFDWLNNNFNFFLDGTPDANNGDITGTDTYNLGGDLTIGQTLTDPTSGTGTGGFTGGEEYNGLLSEVIMYSSQLSTDDRNTVQSYLALKYGLTLNAGDFDYVSPNGSIFFPGNTDANYATFRTDVAGIGRDDLSDFEILTSGSINSTAILSVTKDVTFDANDQYFAWAHNGTAAANGNATDIPSGIEGRLSRVWKIKSTNSPSGTVDITFDLSAQAITVASDLRLLVDGDGTFADATVLSPTITQSGDDFTFNNVALSSLPNEFFFTVATRDEVASPLPLDFLSFTGTSTNGLVSLNWETTNEIDVSYFEVERSENGKDFSYIGNVKAVNISDAINHYSFSDNRPLSGFGFYRLKEVDFDGVFEYSQVITVVNQTATPNILAYPNPTQEFLTVESANVLTGSKYIMVDLMGRKILEGTWDNESGRSQQIDLRLLPIGLYQLSIQTPIGTQRIKVMKK